MRKYRMSLLSRNYDVIYTLTGTIDELVAETYIRRDLLKKAAEFKIWYLETDGSFIEMRLLPK